MKRLIVSNATPVIGTVGLLLYAKKAGLIKAVKPHLDDTSGNPL